MASKGKGKPSDRRAGKRRDRNQRVGTRIPELGYYLIVTDTEETEKNYFEGLRDSIPPRAERPSGDKGGEGKDCITGEAGDGTY